MLCSIQEMYSNKQNSHSNRCNSHDMVFVMTLNNVRNTKKLKHFVNVVVNVLVNVLVNVS